MSKRVRLTDSSLNSHGSRVLTSGCDITQYERNPVLLYMHERGKVIGYMKDLRREGDEITGEPVFDEATELSRQCKKQWEVGSLRMVSIGIDIKATSSDKKDVLEGQTHETITRSKVFECSVVDIGANDNALVMRRGGREVTMGSGSANPLAELTTENQTTNQPTVTDMDIKKLALKLGLEENAAETAVNAKIEELQAAATENATLKAERERMTTEQITAAVDAAIDEQRITADKKEHFVSLGKSVGVEALRTTLAAIPAAGRLSAVIRPGGQASSATSTYKKLSEVPADKIEALKKENEGEYRRLYRAEYGFDY